MVDCDGLIKALSATLGVNLSFSDDGSCAVTFGEDEVIFEEYEGSLYIIAVIDSLDGHNEICRALLEANYLGQDTENATLSIDANREEVVLHRVLETKTEYSEFEKILTSFVKTVRYWKQHIIAPDQIHSVPDFNLHEITGIQV